jgi:hypothetical protein
MGARPKKDYLLNGMKKQADDGNRTHATSLGSWSSTIELHPRMVGDDRVPQV